MAGSQDLQPITVTACTAYEAHAFRARDDIIALTSLPPALASNPTIPRQQSGQYENVPLSSAQGHELTLNCESVGDPFSAAMPTETTATPTAANPTTTSPPQDTEYDRPM